MKCKLKIGIVGCGAIGSALAEALIQHKTLPVSLVGLADSNRDTAKTVERKLKLKRKVMAVETLVAKSDLVVEAAGMQTVLEIAALVMKYKKDLLVMSVGALVVYPEIIEKFNKTNCHLHFPSGAVAGLDALKAAKAVGGIKAVKLTTCKPPSGLAGAPYFLSKNSNPSSIKKPTKIFSGSARQAIHLFPANVNVAAALSLAGIGADKTRVDIIADPGLKRNKHTVVIKGLIGSVECTTENVPSPTNPKTSFLATASALALISSLVYNSRTGT